MRLSEELLDCIDGASDSTLDQRLQLWSDKAANTERVLARLILAADYLSESPNEQAFVILVKQEIMAAKKVLL